MMHSLHRCCPSAHLYVFAFDDACYKYLQKHKQAYFTVISMEEFETPALLEVKSSRSTGEYCWTCTPSIIYHCITKYGLPHCTYIDADLKFYGNPEALISQMSDKESVLITPHNYTEGYDMSAQSGIYCVQFVSFRNSVEGMKVLDWWRKACISWCFARFEDGKFGDQKYLDDWPQRFKGIHVVDHPGCGVAPWNLQQYTFKTSGGEITGQEIATGKKFPVIFFHFHDLRFYPGNKVGLTGAMYEITENALKIFYRGYIRRLMLVKRTIGKSVSNSHGIAAKPALSGAGIKKMIKKTIRKNYDPNIFPLKYFF